MVIAESMSQDVICDAESQVRLSTLSALRHSLAIKNSLVTQLQVEVSKLIVRLNIISGEVQTLTTVINNKTTTDILDVETACERVIATDCCEVSYDRTSFQCAIDIARLTN